MLNVIIAFFFEKKDTSALSPVYVRTLMFGLEVGSIASWFLKAIENFSYRKLVGCLCGSSEF
jgi:hypothetical protein